jgi:hypothetical protein
MHHHNMWISRRRRAWPKKPSSCLSEGNLCKILQVNFVEYLFPEGG